MEELSKIHPAGTIPDRSQHHRVPEKKKHKRRKARHFVGNNLKDLTRIADEAHELLEQRNSPFRLCVYEKDGDVFIDVVALDSNGRPRQIFRQDITHQELEELVQQIKTGRGLVFDLNA